MEILAQNGIKKIQAATIHMMIDFEQVQDGIS